MTIYQDSDYSIEMNPNFEDDSLNLNGFLVFKGSAIGELVRKGECFSVHVDCEPDENGSDSLCIRDDILDLEDAKKLLWDCRMRIPAYRNE